jgi:hypothetical protein
MGVVDGLLNLFGTMYTADQQRAASQDMMLQMGLNQTSQEAIGTQMDQYIASMQVAQQGAAAGDPNAQANADAIALQMAILLADQKDKQGMSPGVIAAIAIGSVAVLGGLVFMITRTGRSAHHPYHY